MLHPPTIWETRKGNDAVPHFPVIPTAPPRLKADLTRNLVWRYSALGNPPPRVTPFVFSIPVGAHADAQGFGHIAAAYANGDISTTHSLLPRWLITLVGETPDESPIFIYEMCAAVLMACVAIDCIPDSHQTCVLLWITNRPLPPLSKDRRRRH